jgi:hypothetical protein
MATVSSLSAPGVEVREYDNSLRITSNTGTTVFVPGFAAQGPVEEVIAISSITDFETIYGIPTNAAERYFYYTVLAILNNSGLGTTVLTSRLPYGEGEGDNVANAYTMLAYPAIPVYKSSSNSKGYNYYDVSSLTSELFSGITPTKEESEVVLLGSYDSKDFEITALTATIKVPTSTATAADTTTTADELSWKIKNGETVLASGSNEVHAYAEYDGTNTITLKVASHLYEDTTTNQIKNHYGYFIAKYTFVKTSDNDTKWDALKKSIEGTGLTVDCSTSIKATYNSAYNTETEAEDTTYVIGAPAVYNVSLNEYYNIITGEGFTWEKPSSDISYVGNDLMANIGKYAFITINTSRSIINDAYEGYYFGITDNLFNDSSDDYKLSSVRNVKFTSWNRKVSTNNTNAGIVDTRDTDKTNEFININKSRLDFYLDSSNKGSISNVLQTSTTSFDTSSEEYDDTINFGVFKLSKSTIGTESMKLNYSIVEKYNAAMGKSRTHSVSNSVSPQNYFVESIIESSKNLTMLVNPHLASKIHVDINGKLRGKVRFAASKLYENYSKYEKTYLATGVSIANPSVVEAFKLASVNIKNWSNLVNRIGAPLNLITNIAENTNSTYNSFNLNDSLYPFATYTVVKKNNKFIGSVPQKLKRALELVSNDEEYPDIDIIVEGGLGTIFAYSNNANNIISEGSSSLLFTENTSDTETDNTVNGEQKSNTNIFNEDAILQGIEDLRTSRSAITDEAQKVVEDYMDVQEAFMSLASSFQNGGRGDTFYIADILRGIVVRGKDTKVEKLYGSAFTSNVYGDDTTVNHSWSTSIYSPIKHLIESFTTSYASIYAQWFKISDGHTNEKFWVPASGYMTALLCASDQLQGPWYAGAGLNRGIVRGVLDCAVNPNQKQRGDLYKICVNSVPKMANIGITCWGIRTLSKKASAFDQNTCRRTFLFIEKAVKKLLRYYLFEPNNSYTQLSIYNEIEPYMESIRNQGGIYSYSVVCDSSNNTPEIVNAGNLAVDISAAPTRTAEFIVLNMTANKYTQDVSTSEFNI